MREPDMQSGVILNYHETRGFGFIKPDGGRGGADNVFFHYTVYQPNDVVPRVGARVMYAEGFDARTGKARATMVEEVSR
jgi:cold shock CspA family protein